MLVPVKACRECSSFIADAAEDRYKHAAASPATRAACRHPHRGCLLGTRLPWTLAQACCQLLFRAHTFIYCPRRARQSEVAANAWRPAFNEGASNAYLRLLADTSPLPTASMLTALLLCGVLAAAAASAGSAAPPAAPASCLVTIEYTTMVYQDPAPIFIGSLTLQNNQNVRSQGCGAVAAD